jgi:hypothetical protein
MDVEQLEKRLEFWKRGLLVALGASVTLYATTLAESSQDGFWRWYFVWVVIWLAVAPPGFYLLMSRKWRKVSLSSRLNSAFGYLGCAWLVLLSAGIRGFSSSNPGCNTLIVITAFVLGAAFWYLRKKKDKSEELFP